MITIRKITVQEIVSIPKGTTKVFILEDRKACHTAQALVSYVNRFSKPDDVECYVTSSDIARNAVIIKCIGR